MKSVFTPEWKSWIQTNINNGSDKDHLFNILIDEDFSYDAIKQEMQYEPILKHEFTEEWQNWIETNVAAGHDKNGIFKILLNHGYSYDAISDEMQFEPTLPVDKLVDPRKGNAETLAASGTTVFGNPLSKDKLFVPNAVALDSDILTLYNLENFLNPDECEYVIEAIKTELRPSELTSYEPDSTFRTSKTCDLGNLQDPIIDNIDHRICRLLGIDPSYSEPIQGQYYEVGQEFKPHTDFFEEQEIASDGNVMGQRTYTVMVYLNSVQEGGVTSYPKVATEFSPTRGMAVIWSNLNPDGSPNINSLHHGSAGIERVTKPLSPSGFEAKVDWRMRHQCCLEQTMTLFLTILRWVLRKHVYLLLCLKNFKIFITIIVAASHTDEVVPGEFIVNTDKKETKASILVDLPAELRDEIHDSLKSMMEKWCGKSLMPTFVYGIRVYKRGSILKSHQDRLETHIISAIINVDQQVDKDWPLSIDDNYYRNHEVILKPGEIIFYEGGRLSTGALLH